MTALQKRTNLYNACKTIFGPDINVSEDFLRYLQPIGLKTAYRKRAFETHPDRAKAVGGYSDDMHRQFRQVRDAYATLLSYVEGRTKRIVGEPVFNGRRKQRYRPRHYRPRTCRRPSDHFYQGRVPQRNLLLGQYLYYSGRISWRALIEAIAWQRLQRPKIGQIALQWGIMSRQQVVTVLSERSFNERFGECAQRIGYISSYEHISLIGRQRKMQRFIGEFFVDRGLLASHELVALVMQQRTHNKTAFKWK